MAATPDRWNRWSVDGLYTQLVTDLRQPGDTTPAAVADEAHRQLIAAYEADNPGADPPSYIKNLGQPEDL